MACAAEGMEASAEIRKPVGQAIVSVVQELRAVVWAGDTGWQMVNDAMAMMKSLRKEGRV